MKSSTEDYLWLNLKALPYFRALLRAVEAKFYKDINLKHPILDLGCGDGHFVTTAFASKIDVGIDPWKEPLLEAAQRDAYGLLVQTNGNSLPFKRGHFHSCISNSVLEHIEELSPVLSEVSRVLNSGDLFIFCVPNHNFLENLSISNLLKLVGMKKMSSLYQKFFNKISRHQHCNPPDVWEKRLIEAGFTIEKFWHYFSPKALHVLEWGHYFGVPSLFVKFVFRRWILIPSRWNLFFTNIIVEKYFYEDTAKENGSYTFYITRKK